MCRMVLAAVLVFVAGAVAIDRPDIPGNISSGPRVAGETDRDQSGPATQSAPAPVWTALEQMNGDERANSHIELELPGDAGPQARARAVTVADLWNRGRYEEALAAFRDLGELVDPSRIAIGNCWRTPVPTMQTTLWGNDVRIGNRDRISVVTLDTHREFGYLFAVLLYQDYPVGNYYWSVNWSPNGGVNWSESFIYCASYPLNTMSASVLKSYCYVGYGAASPNREARVRRFSSDNGKPVNFGLDEDKMYVTVCTTAARDSIKEIALTSNQDYYNNRLYFSSLLYGGAVTFYWATDTGAFTWHEIATGVADGASGLDACSNEGFESTYALISFIDASQNLRIIGVRSDDMLKNFLTLPAGAGVVTSIGAYRDTVLCTFDDYARNPNVVRYVTNYEGGDGMWRYGYAGSDTTTSSESPGVALRKGGGEGLIYRYGTPTRELRYIWCSYSGQWSTPVAVADYEPGYNRPAIEYLDSGAYGVAYLKQSDHRAYFDRSDWVISIAEQRRLVTEENILSVTPNPLTGHGLVNYTLNRAAGLRIQVYDRTGRMVRTLLDGHSPEGRQSLRFDAADMAPGVYFVRADADGMTLTVPVTVVK
jgi:hypothetical protein